MGKLKCLSSVLVCVFLNRIQCVTVGSPVLQNRMYLGILSKVTQVVIAGNLALLPNSGYVSYLPVMSGELVRVSILALYCFFINSAIDFFLVKPIIY